MEHGFEGLDVGHRIRVQLISVDVERGYIVSEKSDQQTIDGMKKAGGISSDRQLRMNNGRIQGGPGELFTFGMSKAKLFGAKNRSVAAVILFRMAEEMKQNEQIKRVKG